MKKILFILMAVALLAACSDDSASEAPKEDKEPKQQEQEKPKKEKQKEEPKKEKKDQTPEQKIETQIKDIVKKDLDNTKVTDLKVNKDASTDEERYIVLVDLEWDVKNSADTTKEMLDMYSDHLAASVADNKKIHELVEFWTVPYQKEGDSILKKTYENVDAGMQPTDEMADPEVF